MLSGRYQGDTAVAHVEQVTDSQAAAVDIVHGDGALVGTGTTAGPEARQEGLVTAGRKAGCC